MNSVLDVGNLGMLTVVTTIIVEVLKTILPQKIPTQIVTLIVSIIVNILFVVISGVVTFKVIILSIFSGFVVAFISMNGFDSLKEIINRFTGSDKNDSGTTS